MPSLSVAKPTTKETLKENEKKWGKPLLAAGWSMLPTVIFSKQKELELTAVDINVLMHLVSHWWYAQRLPYPSIAQIAKRMGVHRSTVQRSLRRMEQRGLLRRKERKNRIRGQLSNEYDLNGLISKATPLAKELIKEKTERKESRKLKIVLSEDDE